MTYFGQPAHLGLAAAVPCSYCQLVDHCRHSVVGGSTLLPRQIMSLDDKAYKILLIEYCTLSMSHKARKFLWRSGVQTLQ